MALKTPISYYGGKQKMLRHIRPLIPEHLLYTESFAGGAVVFFGKEPSKIETLNDINGELINFYKVLKEQPQQLLNEINTTCYSRNYHDFAAFIYLYPYFFNNIKRAWAIWTLSKTSFLSKLDGSFGYERKSNSTVKKFYNGKFSLICDEYVKRLENVQLESVDALKIIKTRDCDNAFHFIDPPYLNTEMGHYRGYTESNFQDLLNLVSRIKGKFMLTTFPNKLIDTAISQHSWNLKKVERTLSASKNNSRKQIEYIVMNY